MHRVPQQHPAAIPFTEPWHYELKFRCDPRAPAVARHTLRAVLSAHPLSELLEPAELLTCELATNSVRHTQGPAAVRLHWRHPALRVSVWAPSPDLPAACGHPRRTPPPEAEGGRGLLLLDTLATRWGGCPLNAGPWAPGGKTIWFELRIVG